ncbi:mannan-binding lectin serine protease 1-like [Branchiostoma floridae x Branchiostoma belcheri]
MGSRLRATLFAVLLISVAFVCGQQTATPPRPTGGTTTPSEQVIVLQAERGRKGNLSSPGFPDNYPNNTKITWRIEATLTDDEVRLEFYHFDLERRKLSGNCSWDSVAVYNADNVLIVRRFCGKELRYKYFRESAPLTLVFISDANEERSGFFARYWAIKGEGKPSQVAPKTISPPPEFYTYCKDLDFKEITIPNFYNHSSVEEILNSTQWQEMKNANISCHPQIQPFLCSLLMPRFTRNISNSNFPCRSWCWEVQHSCSSGAINGSFLNDTDNCRILPDTECVNLEPPEDCYYGNGWNYKGKATLPVESGQTCRNWNDVLDSSTLKYTQWADPRENYCRNIFIKGLEPTCYNKDIIPEPCGVKPCDETACSLPAARVQSGRLSPSRNFYKVGEKVFISCDRGYFMEKEEDMWITCTENGRWSKDWLECSVDYELKLSNTLLDSERYSPQLAPSREHVEVIFEAAVVEIIDAVSRTVTVSAKRIRSSHYFQTCFKLFTSLKWEILFLVWMMFWVYLKIQLWY